MKIWCVNENEEVEEVELVKKSPIEVLNRTSSRRGGIIYI
jgi:hypothetical protein